MPFSPKIIRSIPPNGESKHQVTLQLRHDFPGPREPEEKVDYSETGRQIIARARAEAEQILARAQREAEERARQLAEKAREEGYKQGYREGIEQARAEAEEIRSRARQVLKQAEEQRAKTLESLEREIIGLSVDIAEKILARQLSLDPETVLAIAREALQLVKDREHITIFFNPADRETFEKNTEELKRLLPAHASLNLLSDDSITPGGCIVESEHGKVEATLEARWEAILESLGVERENK